MDALNDSVQAQFREVLAQRRESLNKEIRAKLSEARGERIAPDASASTDGGDRATLDVAGELDLAEAVRDGDELRDVDAALGRLDAGTFGICTDCGDAIAIARLQAYPTAKRCSPCQQAREKRAGSVVHKF